MSSTNPVSPKVIAAASGAGIGGLLTTLALWIIGVTAYDVPATAGAVGDALASVPTPIGAVIGALFVIAGAAIPGYQTTDPKRDPGSNPDVVAFQTRSGMVVAGPASPIDTGTPVNVKQNINVGQPDDDLDDNVDLAEPADFDDGADPASRSVPDVG